MNSLYTKNPFKIDTFACYLAGKALSTYVPLNNNLPWASWDLYHKFTFKLTFISICHNINWDFLQKRMAQYFGDDLNRLTTKYLMKMNANLIKEILAGYQKPGRICAPKRAELIRNIGQILNDRFDGNSLNLVLEAAGVLQGDNGFYKLLDAFKAYNEDPLRKKSNILIHDLIREQILDFCDLENVRPAIEYHIIRLYERTGRVIPKTKEIHDALLHGIPFTPWLAKALREATSEALISTTKVSGKTIPDINYVEWQIARSFCIGSGPRCIRSNTIPKGFPEDVANICKTGCPFTVSCKAFRNKPLLKLKEPTLRQTKTFY